MAEINLSLHQTHHSNTSLASLLHTLDPISLILHQNSNSEQPVPLRLKTESCVMERGPRYKEYAELREFKLQMRMMKQEQETQVAEDLKLTPPRKQVKFQGNLATGRKGSSVLAQSVPDFSSVLRKENRRPVGTLPSILEMTPPSKSCSKNSVNSSNSRGSKSANAGEKKGGWGGGSIRKSYASVEELKSLSCAASKAINGENRGGARNGRATGKTVLGFRQF